jgi:GDPmannose 4,6-dehydratase
VGCIYKIKAELRWQPAYSFEALVQSMVDHDLKELTDGGL